MIPTCKLRLFDVVTVNSRCKYSSDYTEVFIVTGLEWSRGREWVVPDTEVNVTIKPLTDLTEGGTDGFTTSELSLATTEEIRYNRRLDNDD